MLNPPNKHIKKIFYRINSQHLSIAVIVKSYFFQKILGFNRGVPWPVHWSSTIKAYQNIDPGTRSPGLSAGCYIDGRNGIIFGRNVWVGPRVSIISMNHDVDDYNKYIKSDPIIIGDNCWMGTNSLILPAVRLASHTIVAAGAIVTKSFLRENSIIAGVPAKIIKELGEYKGE